MRISALTSPSEHIPVWKHLRYSIVRGDWLLRDGVYHPVIWSTMARAHLCRPLLRLQPQRFHCAVEDVCEELFCLLKRQAMSHIIIFGERRIPVAVKLITSHELPHHTRLVLSAHESGNDMSAHGSNGIYRIDSDRYPFTDTLLAGAD